VDPCARSSSNSIIFCRVRARVLSLSLVGVEPLRFEEQVGHSGQEVVIVVFQVDLRLGLVEDSDGVDGSDVIRGRECRNCNSWLVVKKEKLRKRNKKKAEKMRSEKSVGWSSIAWKWK